jgi:hypothetical protein
MPDTSVFALSSSVRLRQDYAGPVRLRQDYAGPVRLRQDYAGQDAGQEDVGRRASCHKCSAHEVNFKRRSHLRKKKK